MGVDRHIHQESQYVVVQRKTHPAQSLVQLAADDSQSTLDLNALQSMADASAPVQRLYQAAPLRHLPVNQLSNPSIPHTKRTALHDSLRTTNGGLSGIPMDHVNAHRNFTRPTVVQAHAYAQVSDSHLGHGQEQHLSHEPWHAVQQGHVKPAMQLQGIALNDDVGLGKEAEVTGGGAVQFRTGTSQSALEAGKNTRAAQLIGLHSYHPQPVAFDPTIQNMTMPAADYIHWGPVLQRRQIRHGAVRAGDQMVVAQFAQSPMQLLSLPSRRQLTCMLLIGEGALTIAAGIGAAAITSGIGIVPGIMAALSGVSKIARGTLLWPKKDAEGEEIKVDPSRLKLIDALRLIEAILAITGGALAGNPKAIVFGSIKALRAVLTAITDYMGKQSNYPGLRKGLMSISALMQFAEAGLVGSIGADVIGSASEATGAVAKGMTKAGGVLTTAVAGSKMVRGGLQAADVYDYHTDTPARPRNRVAAAPLDQGSATSDSSQSVVPTPTVEEPLPAVHADTEPGETDDKARRSSKDLTPSYREARAMAVDADLGDLPGRVFGGMAAEIEQNIDAQERKTVLSADAAEQLRMQFRQEVEALIMSSINAIEQTPDIAESIMHAGIKDMVGIKRRYMK